MVLENTTVLHHHHKSYLKSLSRSSGCILLQSSHLGFLRNPKNL